jgi:Kef-type K+ transport system membrane component KefB
MIISPFIIEFGASQSIINVFSKFGIAFLLFIVGLHLNPRAIKEIGISSLIIGLGQMILTFFIGFLISLKLLGFDSTASLYIGIAISFSSTIIIMKILADKKQLDSLFGKISIGVLIIQDLVAILVLIVISSVSMGESFGTIALKGFLSGGGLIVFLFLFGFFILPKVTKHIAKSQELLFLFSICWCFVVAALFSYFGFTIEIGALIAGVVLSVSPYSTEISSRIRPLRDFFLIIFFIILGLNIPLSGIGSIIVSAVVLSLVALILKPLILMILCALYGYTKRTNFLVGTTLAQISEFSLILITFGAIYYPASITSKVVSTVILTLVLTIIFSSYMIIYSNEFYKKMSWFAKIFERKKLKKEKIFKKNYEAILFGYSRTGFSILKSLKKLKKNYVVVDFNPDIISSLNKFRIPCLYGDVYDHDFLDDLPLNKVKMVVSTIPDFETNVLLVDEIRILNKKAVIIARAQKVDEALELYEKGADYVLVPYFLGGDYLANMIDILKIDKQAYAEEKDRQIKMLEERDKTLTP